jgi:class 3 adenylate cyclase/pimeloyl-ACP methyl ester carboxylesterase
MEPRIQYAKTIDGVDIAFAQSGKGPDLVCVPFIAQTHAQRVWKLPWASQSELAEMFRVFHYDSRGSGLSQRDAADYSLEAMVRDLEAVVDKAGVRRFALFAYWDGVPVAVKYAATHPEEVSHLILAEGWAVHSDYPQSDVMMMEKALREMDWTLFTNTIGRVLAGFDNPDRGDEYAEYIRASVTAENWRAKEEAMTHWDVRRDLGRVSAPTLVLHLTSNRWLPAEAGQRLAAGIRDARLVLSDDVIDYTGFLPVIADFCGIPSAVLRDTASAPSGVERSVPSGTAIILFADIVDSTALTERLGDTVFRDKARDLDAALRTIIREHAGTPIEGKLLGDGVLAVFTSARQAIEAALACGRSGDDAGLPLHLGLHAGDVIREESNVYGGAVNIASRISGLSAPGEVLVSDTVRSLARTSAGVAFEDRGEHSLKGVGEPVRVWAVREGDA